jgi:hypothetical protein
LGEESPRFMAYIATQDRPWTDVVTAEFTIGNSILQDIWGLEAYDTESTGVDDWVPLKYPDGRPP